jgi:hypothetical protein
VTCSMYEGDGKYIQNFNWKMHKASEFLGPCEHVINLGVP